jgi:hypothetical protein
MSTPAVASRTLKRTALAARVPVGVRRQFPRIRMQFLHTLHGERSLPG